MSEDNTIVELKRRARRTTVLDLIRRRGPVSRGDIARLTHLQIPTITHLITDLMAEGLVKEDGYCETGRGRRSARLAIDPASAFVGGLCAGRGGVLASVVSLDGNPSRPVRSEGALAPDALVEGLHKAILAATEGAGLPPERLRGIGIGLDGYPRASFQELEETLGGMFGIPVRAENDVEAAALGEGWFSGDRSVLFVQVGDCIRSGLVVEGCMHRGAVAGLGLGQVVVEEREGGRFGSGGGGTLQEVASGQAICEAVRRELGRGIRSKLPDLVGGDLSNLTPGIVSDAAGAGDILAFNLLDQTGRWIGAALAWAVCILNPARLLLSGDLVRDGGPLTDAIRREISLKVPPEWEVERRLAFAPSDEETFVRGAAALAVRHLFGQDDAEATICV
ncbi:MAG: ROK family transcriptional regulator [Candidatus Latescibacteria bacterium]|nr:ROK family transcriptional regulator [Candidatus Latescibacterota bacterium]